MSNANTINEKKCRKIVTERSEGFCERCCYGAALTVHHRKKRSQGGLWSPDNCVAVCGDGVRGCHGWIEHNPNDAADEGFHVRPWDVPDKVPLHWRKSRWVLLLENGGMVDVV